MILGEKNAIIRYCTASYICVTVVWRVLNSPGETRCHIHWVWVSYSVCPKNIHHLECFIDSLKLNFLIEPLREPFASVCCIGTFGNVQNHKPPASLQQPQAPVLPKLPFCAHSFLQLIKRSLLYATNEIPYNFQINVAVNQLQHDRRWFQRNGWSGPSSALASAASDFWPFEKITMRKATSSFSQSLNMDTRQNLSSSPFVKPTRQWQK